MNNRKMSADPEFVRKCQELFKEKMDGKVTENQFVEGCSFYEKISRRIDNDGKPLYDGRSRQYKDD